IGGSSIRPFPQAPDPGFGGELRGNPLGLACEGCVSVDEAKEGAPRTAFSGRERGTRSKSPMARVGPRVVQLDALPHGDRDRALAVGLRPIAGRAWRDAFSLEADEDGLSVFVDPDLEGGMVLPQSPWHEGDLESLLAWGGFTED